MSDDQSTRSKGSSKSSRPRTKDGETSSKTRDGVKSSRTKDDAKSSKTNDDVKSSKTRDDVKSSKRKDDAKSSKTKDGVKSSKTKDGVKSSEAKDDVKSNKTKNKSKSPSPSEEKIEIDSEKSSSEVEIRPDPFQKVMIAFSVCVVLVVIAFVIVLVLNGLRGSALRKVCEEIEARKSTGKTSGVSVTEPTVEEIMFCHSLKCKFDVLNCMMPCPFGYRLDSNDCPMGCHCAAKGIMQGDIAFDQADVPIMMDEFGLSNDKQDFNLQGQDITIPLWIRDKNADDNITLTIAYELDPSLSEEQVSSWMRAVDQLQKKTCIKFKKYENMALDYLFVTKTEVPDCNSFIGRKGGRQNIVMGDCFSARHTEHMLMHALGFQHEHSRYDREAHIQILMENVMEEHKIKFRAVAKDRIEPYTTDFDKDSVTMFSGFAFSVAEDKPTIIDLQTSQPLVVADHGMFSKIDILDVNSLYCEGIIPGAQRARTADQVIREGDLEAVVVVLNMTAEATEAPPAWSNWESWGNCDHTCGPEAVMSRYRKCETDEGNAVAGLCPGESVMTLPCKDVPCPVATDLKPRWGEWQEWFECSGTCDFGITYRIRECLQGPCDLESGEDVQLKHCNTISCSSAVFNKFDPWSEWSPCSVECGGGLRSRFRECKNLDRRRAYECGGVFDHDGLQYESEVCATTECPHGDIPDTWFANSDRSKAMEEPAWFLRSTNWIPHSICEAGPKAEWLTGDFNGDGRKDILCRNLDGETKILVAERGNKLIDISWEGKLDKCLRGTLLSGDFNGDKTTDIVCVGVEGFQTRMILYQVRYGQLKEPLEIGNFCVDSKWTIYVIDANGDGKDDILCRDETVTPGTIAKIYFNVLRI